MLIQTIELKDLALDWAVAKCEGLLHDDGTVSDYWQPSILWEQGGAIIEREGISLYLDTNNLWQANIFDGNPAVFGTGVEGSTPLIAAMRCFVASKLGDTVEVPVESF